MKRREWLRDTALVVASAVALPKILTAPTPEIVEGRGAALIEDGGYESVTPSYMVVNVAGVRRFIPIYR